MREKERHLIEVHVAGICFDEDKVLAVKRSQSRQLFPGLWECGGGQVRERESFEAAVKRQLEEELGVIVEPLRVFKTYQILVRDLKQRVIPGLRYICDFLSYAKGEEPKISQEHIDWRWQPVGELDALEFIPGLKEDIREAYKIYRRVKS